MKLRAIALASVIAGVALASHGQAAGSKVVFVDAKGDALAAQASMDIVSTTFETTGTTVTNKVRGKKVTTFTPRALAVSMALAAPPSKDQGRTYVITADIEGCGGFYLRWSPTTALGSYNTVQFACGGPATETGESLIFDVRPKVAGSVITWTIPLKSFPKTHRKAATFNDLQSYTALVEPVFGILSTASIVADSAIDSSAGTTAFRLG